MDQSFFFLLLLSLSETFGKYVYVRQPKNWTAAQKYCRTNYTDLAPVSSAYDNNKLQRVPGNVLSAAWTGLRKGKVGEVGWTWSGGGNVSTFFWRANQPDNKGHQVSGILHNFLWDDCPDHGLFPFFCYRAIVVREKRSWEEALDYCREHHSDLASVASNTETLLIQKELQKHSTTDAVWIGLRFFRAEWQWVDRQPYGYKNWASSGDAACPGGTKQCAALQAGSQKCSGRMNAVAGCGERDAAWQALHCEQKLHFVCY